jgi:hypothetical protein
VSCNRRDWKVAINAGAERPAISRRPCVASSESLSSLPRQLEALSHALPAWAAACGPYGAEDERHHRLHGHE